MNPENEAPLPRGAERRYCQICAEPIPRRRYPSQDEPMAMYRRRRLCSAACALAWKTKPRPACAHCGEPCAATLRTYCSLDCFTRAQRAKRPAPRTCVACGRRASAQSDRYCWYHRRRPPSAKGDGASKMTPGRPRLVAEEKDCERCGATFSRRERGYLLHQARWEQRRECWACASLPGRGAFFAQDAPR